MFFGITNAPSIFMRLMNHVLRDCINRLVVVYFDNILVYNWSLHGHIGHMRVILSTFRDTNFFSNVDKCTFCVDSMVLLGSLSTKMGFMLTPRKSRPLENDLHLKMLERLGASTDWQAFIRDLFLTSLVWLHPLMNW